MTDKRSKTIRKTVAPKRTVATASAEQATTTTVAATDSEVVEPSTPAPHDRIAEHAYARFVARGYVHGHDVEDWLAAETDL